MGRMKFNEDATGFRVVIAILTHCTYILIRMSLISMKKILNNGTPGVMGSGENDYFFSGSWGAMVSIVMTRFYARLISAVNLISCTMYVYMSA